MQAQVNDKISFDTFLVNFNSSFISSKVGTMSVFFNFRDINYSYQNLARH